MDLVSCVFFVNFFAEGLVLENSVESTLDGVCLLLDQLDSVGQEDNLFFLCEGQVVVHRGDGNTGLTETGREVDNGVAVLAFLEEGFLIVSKINFYLGAVEFLLKIGLCFLLLHLVFIVIDVLILVFHVERLLDLFIL